MKVHYKLFFAIMMITCGIIIITMNLFLLSVGSSVGIQLIMGIFFTVLGFVYLNRPVFELRENEIVLFNGFGMVVKRHTFDSMADLSVVDNKIFMEKNGERKRIRLSSSIAKKAEWDQFVEMIQKHSETLAPPKSTHSNSDLIDDINI